MTFDEAGSDDDLHAAHLQRIVAQKLDQGGKLLASARERLAQASDRPSDLVAEAEASSRAALATLASALNWAEDTESEDEAHRKLDEAGRWVRETFGCHIEQSGSDYWQACPVALGHNRIGLSIGGMARRICSLCGGDLSECEHRRGTAYMVPGGSTDLGWCRVCLQKDGCEHKPDETYRVGVVSIIVGIELTEVSLVGKPANPDARLTRVRIDASKLSDSLGPDFVPGMAVSCDKCLAPCTGLIRHSHPHG